MVTVRLVLALIWFSATCALAADGSVTQIMFTIAPGDRVASIASVPVTLVVTTQAALAINGKITLNYPAGFFAGTPNPAGVSTFLFTTQSYAAAGGTITITLPANYFSVKASPAGLLIGTIVCTTVTAVLAAGAHKITFAAGESTTAGAFVAANNFMITTSGNDQSAATEIEVIAVPTVKSVSMAMGAADNFTTIVTTALTTFSSNQNQTQHPSLLQAWQDKFPPPRPKNQGLLICSTALELAASPSSFFTVVEALYSINQAHIDFSRVFFHLAIFFCLMQMAITFDAFILIRAVLLRFVNVFHRRSRPRGFNLGLIAFSVFASSLSLGVMGLDYFIEVSSLKALS
jgi:hypothetical protein